MFGKKDDRRGLQVFYYFKLLVTLKVTEKRV